MYPSYCFPASLPVISLVASEPSAVYPALLPSSETDNLSVASIADAVGLCVFHGHRCDHEVSPTTLISLGERHPLRRVIIAFIAFIEIIQTMRTSKESTELKDWVCMRYGVLITIPLSLIFTNVYILR